MLGTLSILLSCILPAISATPVSTLSSGDTHLQCTFHVDRLEFNLCPLLGNLSASFNIVIDEETPPTHTRNTYAMSLGGPLKRDVTLPADLQCVEGTRICLTVINTRPNHPSEPSRILQVIPIAGADLHPTAVLGNKLENDDLHAPLQITFHGELYNTRKQWAAFFFYCDRDVDEPTSPTFMWKFNGTHAFSWRTKHACHKPISLKPPPGSEQGSDPPQQPPGNPESSPGEDTANQPHTFSLVWKLIFVLFMAHLVISVSSRRRYINFPMPTITRHRPQYHLPRPFLTWPYAVKWCRFSNSISGLSTIHSSVDNEYEDIPLTPNVHGPEPQLGGLHSPGYYGSFPSSTRS